MDVLIWHAIHHLERYCTQNRTQLATSPNVPGASATGAPGDKELGLARAFGERVVWVADKMKGPASSVERATVPVMA